MLLGSVQEHRASGRRNRQTSSPGEPRRPQAKAPAGEVRQALYFEDAQMLRLRCSPIKGFGWNRSQISIMHSQHGQRRDQNAPCLGLRHASAEHLGEEIEMEVTADKPRYARGQPYSSEH